MTPLGSAAFACRSRITGPSIDGSFSPPSVASRSAGAGCTPARAPAVSALSSPSGSGLDLERAVEPVVLAHGGAVEVLEVDLRRVVDHVLRHRGAQHAVVLVQELARDRVLAS